MQRQPQQILIDARKKLINDYKWVLLSVFATLLPKLPDEDLFAISEFLSLNDLIKSFAAWTRTSKKNHSIFQPHLDLMKLAHFLVVKPDVNTVIDIIRKYPAVLETVIPLVEVRGVLIVNYKPYQLAHASRNEWMCGALKEEMIKIYGSNEAATVVIQQQIGEKFPDDKENDARIKNKLASMLTTANQAITNEQFNLGGDQNKLKLNDATLTAIKKFSQDLDELCPKIIESGMLDRTDTIQETLDNYVKIAGQWNYDFNKCVLFEDGFLAQIYKKILSINIAEDCSQGLYYLQDKKEARRAQLNLRDTNTNFYTALSSPSHYLVLSSSCVNIIFGRRTVPTSTTFSLAVWRSLPDFFETYVRQKQQTCRTYAATSNPETERMHDCLKK